MKRHSALLLAPVLGLASGRGIIALVLAFLAADRLDRSWRGLGHWWLPLGLYVLFYLGLLVWAFSRSRRAPGGGGTETP